MSLDNAAIVPVMIVQDDEFPHLYESDARTHSDDCDCMKGDEFDAMSDRELLLYNARTLKAAVAAINSVVDSVAPAMERLQKHPLLGGLFR